jgi:hypothetical protein
MSNLLTTFMLTFTFLLLAVFGLAIGWILKGRVLKKNCGRPLDANGECGKDQKCELCAPPKPEDES